MAAKPQDTPGPRQMRCDCGQVIARITGKTVRSLVTDFTFRDNRAIIICPACGKRYRVGSGVVEREAA